MSDLPSVSETSLPRPRVMLWFMWVLATTVGWGLGGYAGTTAGAFDNIIEIGFASVALGVAASGLLQWLVLRNYLLVGAAWWLLSSVIAVALVGLVVFGVGAFNVDFGWVAGILLLGTALGLTQWFVLRGQCARSGWWIFASTAGWLVAVPGVGFVSATVNVDLGWPAVGAVYGAITATFLVWLRPHPPVR